MQPVQNQNLDGLPPRRGWIRTVRPDHTESHIHRKPTGVRDPPNKMTKMTNELVLIYSLKNILLPYHLARSILTIYLHDLNRLFLTDFSSIRISAGRAVVTESLLCLYTLYFGWVVSRRKHSGHTTHCFISCFQFSHVLTVHYLLTCTTVTITTT